MTRLVLALAALPCLAFAPAPFPGRDAPDAAAAKDDLGRMQGHWHADSVAVRGLAVGEILPVQFHVQSELAPFCRRGEVVGEFILRLEHTAKGGAYRLLPVDPEGKAYSGRYEFRGDRLQFERLRATGEDWVFRRPKS